MTRLTPGVLYHASPNRNLTLLEPSNKTTRDISEGSLVFATPDKALASIFLVPTDDSWAIIGRFNDSNKLTPWHLIVSNKRRFKKLDKGGAIYHLSAKGFSSTGEQGMGHIEWTSPHSARPIDKDGYDTATQAMEELGVNIYFVNRRTLTAIKKASDDGREIISTLIPVPPSSYR